jgi:hypothetical protein
MILTSDTRDIIEKHKLGLVDYIKLMSRSCFFICSPGWLMPHSHNLIEAMSVGTIPITNYHHYMRPPLTPDINCLTFSTLEELEYVIERALNMTSPEIQNLRNGVIAYYEQYLAPESFAEQLLKSPPQVTEIVMNDESGR